MKHIIALIVFITGSPLFGEDFTIYAPSRASKSLLIAKAISNDGKLTLTREKSIDLGFAATTITQHAELPILYVSINFGKPDECPGAIIMLNDSGNKIIPCTFKHGYSFLSLDRENNYLLGVNYRDGFVDVYSLNEDGTIGKHVKGLDEKRKNAHCVLPSPDNKFVYIPYVKDTNGLLQYRFDTASGNLTPLDPHNANPPKGTGPRHMTYHPNQPFVYFSNEQGIGASVYKKQKDGQLTFIQNCEVLDPSKDKTGMSASDVKITPDGKFLFTGMRARAEGMNHISRYKILADGKLEFLGLTPADHIPWGLALSPDANYLVATAFKGGTISAYRIGENGELTREASLAWDTNVSDVETR